MTQLDDPKYPNITYRLGASGIHFPALRGTGIRVQTIILASQNNTPADIASDYELPVSHVQEALSFYKAHRTEIDSQIQAEAMLERGRGI